MVFFCDAVAYYLKLSLCSEVVPGIWARDTQTLRHSRVGQVPGTLRQSDTLELSRHPGRSDTQRSVRRLLEKPLECLSVPGSPFPSLCKVELCECLSVPSPRAHSGTLRHSIERAFISYPCHFWFAISCVHSLLSFMTQTLFFSCLSGLLLGHGVGSLSLRI